MYVKRDNNLPHNDVLVSDPAGLAHDHRHSHRDQDFCQVPSHFKPKAFELEPREPPRNGSGALSEIFRGAATKHLIQIRVIQADQAREKSALPDQVYCHGAYPGWYPATPAPSGYSIILLLNSS